MSIGENRQNPPVEEKIKIHASSFPATNRHDKVGDLKQYQRIPADRKVALSGSCVCMLEQQ